ncbi:uncharacterized protein KY384_004177 [Bacidia gigantensis]|uniref:uncharacterized protein n=1 Tax=Bacidia gigantensis TaxID=2732470 RepID=UPI001D03AA27|nr:uncharacterized protein KY384_004177 [Bacidia gigantensis]KAG8530820.1 hypothetical protein KY384_004177 [Bacidia gigantensis]
MNDNDRLQREKKLAIVKFEEEVKRGESARSALESLQLSNANLTAMHESDTTLLVKRDRRIQQLRDDLLAEGGRREGAERETRETRRERDETVEALRKEAAEDREQCSRATTQYDMVSQSFRSLEERYSKQTKTLHADLAGLKSTIETDKRRLMQMEVVMEQMAKEAERTRRAKDKLSAEFEAYKAEQEEATRHIREMARHQDETTNNTHRQMIDALGRMKYIINVKRDLRDAA